MTCVFVNPTISPYQDAVIYAVMGPGEEDWYGCVVQFVAFDRQVGVVVGCCMENKSAWGRNKISWMCGWASLDCGDFMGLGPPLWGLVPPQIFGSPDIECIWHHLKFTDILPPRTVIK